MRSKDLTCSEKRKGGRTLWLVLRWGRGGLRGLNILEGGNGLGVLEGVKAGVLVSGLDGLVQELPSVPERLEVDERILLLDEPVRDQKELNDEPQANAGDDPVSDVVGEGNHDQDRKGWQGLLEVRPVHAVDVLQHHASDEREDRA